MEYAEARGVFVQEIRHRLATQLLIDGLEAADRAQTLLDGLDVRKSQLETDLLDLMAKRKEMIAEATATAEREAKRTVAQYEQHVAQARGQLESTQAEIRKCEEDLQKAHQANADRTAQWHAEEEAHSYVLKDRRKEISLLIIERDEQRRELAEKAQEHRVQATEWEREYVEAVTRKVAVQQEITALLARLGT